MFIQKMITKVFFFFFFKLFLNEMEHEYKQITVYPASSNLYL